MDEATNALDDLTESDLMTALQELRGQRTLILIAHRLSTMQHCDRIIEMQSGVIVGAGTYDEWLRASGTFGRLRRELSGAFPQDDPGCVRDTRQSSRGVVS
jgi:ABC-type multidrug transport system fused ATPase/permease subunit